jgi:hypothetical protein
MRCDNMKKINLKWIILTCICNLKCWKLRKKSSSSEEFLSTNHFFHLRVLSQCAYCNSWNLSFIKIVWFAKCRQIFFTNQNSEDIVCDAFRIWLKILDLNMYWYYSACLCVIFNKPHSFFCKDSDGFVSSKSTYFVLSSLFVRAASF